MNKRDDVTIRATANGYMVEPAYRDNETFGVESVLVFESMERLTAWVAVHFSKAEPVKAPEADRCAHDWIPSQFCTELFCEKCGARREA